MLLLVQETLFICNPDKVSTLLLYNQCHCIIFAAYTICQYFFLLIIMNQVLRAHVSYFNFAIYGSEEDKKKFCNNVSYHIRAIYDILENTVLIDIS
jgi:hypothetical protein